MAHYDWLKATENLPTKSAKIRALNALGVPRAEIARFLDIRYQHVRNVLTQERPATRGVQEMAAVYDARPDQAQVEADGSVRIPASIAAQLKAAPGEVLAAIHQDGGLWIATRQASRDSARRMVQAIIPKDADWMGMLCEDRQRENDRLDRLSKPYSADERNE